MYLGIDLGTSELKALLLDEWHRVVATAASALPISRPQPGWSEQSPDDWWRGCCAAIEQLRAKTGAAWRTVRAIGLSGQMHGAVLLDDRRQPLRPAMLWNDTRAEAECSALAAALPDWTERAGNLAMPGFTAPKLVWLARHDPQCFARVRHVLLPKDWLRWRLAGVLATDLSDAAGTLWLDIARRDWSDALLGAGGMRREQMPALFEGPAATGVLAPDLAAAWGLGDGVSIAAGGGDNAASAVGIGAVEPGDGFVSLGTSGVIFTVNASHRANPAQAVHAFCHALPGRWHHMSVMLSAASCLAWLGSLLGETPAALAARAEALPADARRRAPLFLPYLSGERTPHNDAALSGLFTGLGHASSAAQLAYAVMEGVAFGMADGADALRAAGSRVERLPLLGGGSRSALWAQLHADALGTPVLQVDGGEQGAALGAARLAWLADGAPEHAVCLKPPLLRAFEPQPEHRDATRERHHRFRALRAAARTRTER